ncbi:MAG: hypothetical protein JWR85_1206 [Marmoricola sp.]|nr:hypothetical protein [Marmoricola sp.]
MRTRGDGKRLRTDLRRRSDLLVSLVLAVVVLGPMLLRRGYVLRGDMVFVPDQPWKDSWLGLDGRVPRFVPGDAFLAAAGSVLPGDLVQKLVLLVALVVGGVGAGRLVGAWGSVPRAAAITFFLWNPWVAERLGIGQWGVVVGYLLLPWIALAAERVRDDNGAARRPAWCVLVVWLGISAVFSPASGLVALATATGVLLVRARWRRVAGVVLAGLAVNLPWILPSLLHNASLDAPAGQFPAFAATGESSLGVVASVLSLGGIWKSSVVPPERTVALMVGLSLVLTLVGLLGLRLAARTQRARVIGLGIVGAASVVLALVTAVPFVADFLDDAAAAVPALGILRDSHRYLGPAALALLPGLAAATAWLEDHAVRGREALRLAALLVVVAPVLALPSLAWGLGGDWRPVDYPKEWYAVRDQIPPGRTVVLPWRGGYRGFKWNDRRSALDPAPRFFPGDVLIDDRLVLTDRTIASEDPLLRAVRRAVESTDPAGELRRLGVRSVLEEKGNGVEPPQLDGAGILHDGPGLTLIDLGPVTAGPTADTRAWQRRVILGVDAVVLLGWLLASGLALRGAIQGTRRRSGRVPPLR